MVVDPPTALSHEAPQWNVDLLVTRKVSFRQLILVVFMSKDHGPITPLDCRMPMFIESAYA